MSTDKHTEAPPLDPHTLRVVIERLGERITHAETERENDASEGLPADEMADWDTRIETLEVARWDIENIAKTANPRARVVVLPEPESADGDWAEWECADVQASRGDRCFVQWASGDSAPGLDYAKEFALAILAAAEFAGGAK